MSRFAKAAFALAMAATLSSGPVVAGDTDEPERFNAPSGNISCHYTPPGELPSQKAGLHCDRFQPSPARLFLGETGKADIQHGIRDACCDNEPALAYGTSWSRGPFTCRSEQTGMTCRRPDGHGFFVSRASLRAY